MSGAGYRAAFLVLVWAAPGMAAQAVADSSRVEAAARHLEEEIVAPCCWRQSVADHTSAVALEIRQEIRRALYDGMTPEQVKAMYVRKYGERILMVPPRQGFNYVLWLIPIAASIGAFGVASHLLRRWRKGVAPVRQAPTPAAATNAALAKVDQQLKDWIE